MTELLVPPLSIDRRTVLGGALAGAGALLVPKLVRAAGEKPKSGGMLKVSMPYNPAAIDPMTTITPQSWSATAGTHKTCHELMELA